MKWHSYRGFLLLLATAASALPSSGPNHGGNGPYQAAFRAPVVSEDPFLQWELPPDPNSTHHLIFDSVSGFLQRWPNTFRRNGHSLVPATIPPGTILYHGRTDDQVPDIPDWLAFDFEHAFMFCVSPCHVITVQAKRNLRLLYFDGSSAAKMPGGPMDSQDVVTWGEPRPDKYFSERERINALCDWGKPFGLDGFVRMEFHFEVMICSFSDGVEVVTHLDLLPTNVTAPNRMPLVDRDHPHEPPPPPPPPRLPPHPKIPHAEPPPGWHGSLPHDALERFETHVAGGWDDHAPGETRVHLDYAGLVTFYDTALSSLVDARHGKDRMHHSLEGISPADAARVLSELESVLARNDDDDGAEHARGSGSGVDWASVAHVVVVRHAERLEYLRFLLSPHAATKFADAAGQAATARARLLVMLVPYITPADVLQQQPRAAPANNASWAAPVVRRCATTQTSRIPLGLLTPQEARIHAAVEGTLREICRRLVLVWLEFFDVEEADEAGAARALEVGHGHIDELMRWLGWSLWVRCEPACALGENCYIPSWPFLKGDDPDDMTPRCISPEDAVR